MSLERLISLGAVNLICRWMS